MAFCPNKNSKDYKDLEAVQGSAVAHYLWDKFRGDIPSHYYKVAISDLGIKKAKTTEEKKAWLTERGISVEVFDSIQNIGSEEVHGYVENAAVYLWSQANEGTEYHEAYHVVFRSMLSNAQRAALYAEAAAKLGEPTAQDIANVRKAFPEISDEEARMVALEEKMADDFKEYVLTEGESAKTLPGKIAKFFKDIWNFLKAIFSNGLSLRQMYSLLESNKMNSTLFGKGVFRNAEKFKGPDKAYMYRPEMGERMFKDTLNTLYTVFMEEKEKNDLKLKVEGQEDTFIRDTIGAGNNPGSIVKGYIKKLYVKTDGGRLTDEVLMPIFAAELRMDNAKTPEDKAAAKAEVVALLKAANANFGLGDRKEVRMVYKNIAATWNDLVEPTTGNIKRVGWRSFLEIKLREAGIAIKNGKARYEMDINNELEEEDREDLETEFDVIEEAFAKIYGKSSLESSPAKRLTGKIKEALSTIKSNRPNLLGVITYMDREDVYKELLELFHGKSSFFEMKESLKKAAELKPNLRPLLEFMNGIQGPQAAMFFSAFALTNTEYIMIKRRLEGSKVYADIINPNRKDIVTGAVDKWKNQLVRRGNTNPRALYNEVPRLDTNGEPMRNSDGSIITVLKGEKEKLLAAQVLAKEAENALKGRLRITADAITADGSISKIVDTVAQLMWTLGMNVGDDSNIAETKWALQSIVNTGVEMKSTGGRLETIQGGPLLGLIADDLITALKIAGNFSEDKNSRVAALNKIEATATYVSLNPKLVTKIAEYFGPLLKTVGESFVNAQGKAIYPTNLASHMNDIVNTIKNGNEEGMKMMTDYMSDPFINGGNVTEFSSILFRHLKSAPAYLKQFRVVDFDATKGDNADDTQSYEDFSKVDNLITRINAFINNDPKSATVFIAVPVQSDRNKFSFIEVPRVLAGKFGIQQSEAQLVKAQIVQDLLRVAAAKKAVHNAISSKDTSKLIEGYHTKRGDSEIIIDPKTGTFAGNAFNESFFQFTAKNENGFQIVTDVELGKDNTRQNGVRQLSDVIEKYVKGELLDSEKATVDNHINGMVREMSEYFTRQAKQIEKAVEGKVDEVGTGPITGEKLDLYRGFIVTETIMRNELVKLFRGNRAMTKDLADFYKRMGHLTTPGTRIAMQGEVGEADFIKGELYGMIKEFNELTMRDLQLDLTKELKDQANLQADNIAVGLIKDSFRGSNLRVDVVRNSSSEKGVVISGQNVQINLGSENLISELNAAFPNIASNLTNAISIADAYRPGKYDSTDAQAFISLDMHRYISMGLGQWGPEEEEAFKAYKKTGKFVYQPGFVPAGFKTGDAVPTKPWKPYYESLEYSKELNTLLSVSEKNSYSVLLQDYTKDFPNLEDLRQRMEGTGTYKGLKPVHVVNFVSGKKLAKRGVYKSTGIIGEYSTITVNTNKSNKLRFPQFIPGMKEDSSVTLNRQIKKNMISNVLDETQYSFNPGLSDEFSVDGRTMKTMYHAAIEEKINRDTERVLDELGITKLREAVASDDINVINKVKLEVLKSVRGILAKQLQENDLPSNYSTALNIAFDATGAPKFSIPLDLPIYNKKYESIVMSILNNNVFKQKAKGFEAVQVAQLGGHKTDKALKFLQISEDGRRVIHAEIMIREDVARKFGIQPGQSLDEIPEELRRVIGYRIPNQDKASVVICKIAKILPANYEKAVVVPGQLLKLMGSDHDVDKLNLLFPEVAEDAKSKYGVSKVKPNYSALLANMQAIKDPSVITDQMLNNIVLDTIESVYSNPAHFREVFTPLDDTTLSDKKGDEEKGEPDGEVYRIRKAMPQLAEATDWNAWDTEANTIVRNMRGNKLRGIYANILAGRNVAMHGRVELKKSMAIEIDGVKYTSYLSEVDGIPTDKAISLWLSAAVDASKLPVQYELNDSELTSRVRALFLAYYPEYNSATCTNLLNQPVVREMTELFETKYKGNLTKIKKAYEAIVTKYKLTLPAKNITTTLPMSSAELSNLSPIAGRDMAQQAIILHNFMKFYDAGMQLMNLYKRITPDSMDGMNRIGSIQGFKDRAGAFESRNDSDDGIVHKDVIFFGPEGTTGNVVDQFVGENSIYGMERGYENLMNEGLAVASNVFPVRTSPAFLTFKERLKTAISNNKFTPEMHQLVDYNLMFMMLMKENSPFFENVTYSSLYENPKDNIGSRLTALKTAHRALASNPFIANIESDVLSEVNYYGVKFDASGSATRNGKEAMTNGLRAMLYNPISFVSASKEDKIPLPNGTYKPEVQEEINKIKRLGRDLVMHTFMTNGFRQSSSSYADLVPVEFFTTPMKVKGLEEKISIAEYFEQEKKELNDPNYFDAQDLLKYLTMFGKMRAGNSGLLESISGQLGLNAQKEIVTKGQVEVKLGNKTVKLAVVESAETHRNFVIVKDKSTKASAIFQRLDYISGKSIYVALKGSYSEKGGTKIYGSGIAAVLSKDFDPGLADTYISRGIWEVGQAPKIKEAGNVSCAI